MENSGKQKPADSGKKNKADSGEKKRADSGKQIEDSGNQPGRFRKTKDGGFGIREKKEERIRRKTASADAGNKK